MTLPASLTLALHIGLVFDPAEWELGWNGRVVAPLAGAALMLGPLRLGVTFNRSEEH